MGGGNIAMKVLYAIAMLTAAGIAGYLAVTAIVHVLGSMVTGESSGVSTHDSKVNACARLADDDAREHGGARLIYRNLFHGTKVPSLASLAGDPAGSGSRFDNVDPTYVTAL